MYQRNTRVLGVYEAHYTLHEFPGQSAKVWNHV